MSKDMPIFFFRDIWSLRITVAGNVARMKSVKAEYAAGDSEDAYNDTHRSISYHQRKMRIFRQLRDSNIYVGHSISKQKMAGSIR